MSGRVETNNRDEVAALTKFRRGRGIVVLALSALALLVLPPSAQAAQSGCGLCMTTSSSCWSAAVACVLYCGGPMTSCEWDGACQGPDGTYYPLSVRCLADE